MSGVGHSFALLFALLNPFLLAVYMLEAIRSLSGAAFRVVVVKGAIVALAVFALFAVAGDSIFGRVVPARFASFQIFGGLVFLQIGLRYVLTGAEAITAIRGPLRTDAGAVAFLYFVGPGTISASIVVGGRHDVPTALAVVTAAVALATAAMIVLKLAFDRVRARRASMLDRELEILGRMAGLLVGTFAVDMMLSGAATFWRELAPRAQ